MADPVQPAAVEEERPHIMQQILENPFLLLFLGVAVPTVIYIVWGVMDLRQDPAMIRRRLRG